MSIEKLANKYSVGAWIPNVKEFFKKINEIINYLNSYKSYVALLNQSGTDNPVATVLANTLGKDVTWTRSNTGRYQATILGDFPTNGKVLILTGSPSEDAPEIGLENSDTIKLNTNDPTTTDASDNYLINFSIEIRIYN